MRRLFLPWLAATSMMALQTQNAHADEKKVVRDKRTPYEIAWSECSSEATRSKWVILYGVTGGLLSYSLTRDRFIKDCVTSRGFKYVPKKRKKIEYNR